MPNMTYEEMTDICVDTEKAMASVMQDIFRKYQHKYPAETGHILQAIILAQFTGIMDSIKACKLDPKPEATSLDMLMQSATTLYLTCDFSVIEAQPNDGCGVSRN